MTVPLGPWTLKNPREPKVQVGVGNKQTTICTEPTPEELIKVRWISAKHETRSNRQSLCGRFKRGAQALSATSIQARPINASPNVQSARPR